MHTTLLQSTDSTNDYIKRNLDRLSPPHLVRAHYQTAGRGRRERGWQSASGLNFLGSFLLEAQKSDQQALMAGALALLDTLAEYGIHASIKLPNDILYKGGKLAGILIENLQGLSRTVMGIGLNVNETFEETQTTSIREWTHRTHDIGALAGRLFRAVLRRFHQPTEKLFPIFKEALDLHSGRVLYRGRVVNVASLTDDFRCVLEDGRVVDCGRLTFERGW